MFDDDHADVRNFHLRLAEARRLTAESKDALREARRTLWAAILIVAVALAIAVVAGI